MKTGIERYIDDMRGQRLAVDGPMDSGQKVWAIVRGFVVRVGRFAHTVVDIAVPPPLDYPSTPPGGLYVSPCIAPLSVQQVLDRSQETGQLPGCWQYWSRPIPPGTWTPDRGGKRLVAHWNSVFANYPLSP
jgi:hypothetical protein